VLVFPAGRGRSELATKKATAGRPETELLIRHAPLAGQGAAGPLIETVNSETSFCETIDM